MQSIGRLIMQKEDFRNSQEVLMCLRSIKKISEDLLGSQFELGIPHEDKTKIYHINFLATSIITKEANHEFSDHG